MNDIVFLLIVLVALLVIAYVAKYIIDNFFPGPLHVPVLALVGIVLLITLLWIASQRFGVGWMK